MRAMLIGLLLFASPLHGSYEEEIARLAKVITSRLSGEPTVAVVDFRNLEGQVSSLGRFLADEFSVGLLMSTESVQLFDRGNLQRLMDEVQLSEDGIVSPETAKTLELAGVDILITGLLTPLGQRVRVSLRALNTSTARVVSAASGSLELDDELSSLLGRTIRQSSTTSGRGTPGGQLVLPGAQTIGTLRIALTDFRILTDGRLAATFAVENLSEQTYLIGLSRERNASAVTSNTGLRFTFVEGLHVIRDFRGRSDQAKALTLMGQQMNEFTLYFTPETSRDPAWDFFWGKQNQRDVDYSVLGSRFSATLSLATLNIRSERSQNFAATFRDISVGK